MNRRLNPLRIGLFILLGAGLGLGCKPPLPPMAPVKGKVTVNDQPLTSGNVTFEPVDKQTGPGTMSAGQVQSDGTYEIHTAGQSGAPLGKYRVTITPSMTMAPPSGPGGGMAAMMPFDQKYGDAQKTPFQSIEVIKSPEPGRYDLKLTK